MAKAGRTWSAADHARRVVGTDGGVTIEVLEAVGDGMHGHVVLRITSVEEASGFQSGSRATACFRYVYSDTTDEITPHETSCGHRRAIALPEPSPLPTLPGQALDRLRRALQEPDPAAAVAAAFGGLGLGVSTTVVDGNLGVAVSARANGCVFGRRTRDGKVEVWVVPGVLAQPGELGCGAEFAARGEGTQPPH
jgi:hypothetical protein